MAAINNDHLVAIANENQRMVDAARDLLSLQSQLQNNPAAVAQLRQGINTLLDVSVRISQALEYAQ